MYFFCFIPLPKKCARNLTDNKAEHETGASGSNCGLIYSLRFHTNKVKGTHLVP